MPLLRFLASLLLGLASAACAATGDAVEATRPDRAADVEALLAADRAFCEDALARGLDGWMDWFHPDAAKVLFGAPTAQGLDAVRSASAPLFADPSVALRWEPDEAGVIEPGELGFTVGRYELVSTADGAEIVLGTGHYLTVWRRTAGRWVVALDTGVADGG